MCPSGRRPFGNRESSTNSGSVKSSSLESENLVPLKHTVSQTHFVELVSQTVDQDLYAHHQRHLRASRQAQEI